MRDVPGHAYSVHLELYLCSCFVSIYQYVYYYHDINLPYITYSISVSPFFLAAMHIAENTFVVITGSDPQAGKKARIKQVRSHVTKDYYRKQKQEQQKRRQRERQGPVLICAAPSPSQSTNSIEQISNHSSSNNSPRLTREVKASIPFTCNPLLDPDFLSAEMARRVQQCKFYLRERRIECIYI